MSFRRNPTLSNNVISFKEGPLLQEPLSILKDEITMLRGKLDDMRSDTRSDSRTEAIGRIDMLEKSLMMDVKQKRSAGIPSYHDVNHGVRRAPRDTPEPFSRGSERTPEHRDLEYSQPREGQLHPRSGDQPSAVLCEVPVYPSINLVGSPINYGNRLIGSPITSQSTVPAGAPAVAAPGPRSGGSCGCPRPRVS
jgi:hypothetical protein